MKNIIGFGCVGVGQAGVNLADKFSTKFTSIAIDTASQNLNELKNIKEDLKIHTKINEFGGAGKNCRLGEKAIIEHKEDIIALIRSNLSECDYVWITAGLGGGSGTLGSVQLSVILNKLGINHGMMVTLPAEHEGTDENVNAATGLYAIEKIRKIHKHLRSIVIIENQKLLDQTMKKNNITFEIMWDKANEYVFKSFYKLFEYSQKDSKHTFDGQDYMRLLMKSGYMIFGKKRIPIKNSSDNVLVNVTKGMWEDDIFVEGLNFNNAKGLAVIISRPEGYENDGQAISNMLAELKSFIGEGTFCYGIYKNNPLVGQLSYTKPIEIFTALNGMPFPYKRYKQLQKSAENDIDNYNKKEEEVEINLNVVKMAGYMNDEDKGSQSDEEFSLFNHKGKEQKEKDIELTPIDWD